MSETTSSACCAPLRNSPVDVSDENKHFEQSKEANRATLVKLEGGTFLMGTNDPSFPADGEGPVREVTVNSFWIDKFAVTNKAFARFAEETGYQTEAERFGWSFVFHSFLPKDHPPTQGVAGAPWWRQVYGANWQHPEGSKSNLKNRLDHPVVHVSWHDATQFAAWTGGRLPTEAEWEYAARGGLKGKTYPWGDRLSPKGKYRCNIWQGTFPDKNTAKDGFMGTAPVNAFEQNGYGLYNMVGNVWEWCSDWWSSDYHRTASRHNPKGPDSGSARVTKGGSYLCHASYCNRYRVAARTQNTPDSSTGHMGFRIVRDDV